MWAFIKAAVKVIASFFKALFDPLAVVILMTTLALIITLLTYAAPSTSPSRGVLALCWIIGVIGGLALIAQVFKIVKQKLLQQSIADFYITGHSIINKCIQSQSQDYDQLKEEYLRWRNQVIPFLRKRCGEAHVVRLDSYSGMTTHSPASIKSPYDELWRAMTNHLYWLDRFSRDKDST